MNILYIYYIGVVYIYILYRSSSAADHWLVQMSLPIFSYCPYSATSDGPKWDHCPSGDSLNRRKDPYAIIHWDMFKSLNLRREAVIPHQKNITPLRISCFPESNTNSCCYLLIHTKLVYSIKFEIWKLLALWTTFYMISKIWQFCIHFKEKIFHGEIEIIFHFLRIDFLHGRTFIGWEFSPRSCKNKLWDPGERKKDSLTFCLENPIKDNVFDGKNTV